MASAKIKSQANSDKRRKYILFSLLKLLVVALALFYLYKEVFAERNTEELMTRLLFLFTGKGQFYYFFFVFLLMIFNWGAESLKWQFLIGKIERVKFWRACMATLSGVTVSVFMPNRTGEFLGRIIYLDQADKVKGSLVAVIGSMAQLLITLVCGSIAFSLFFYSEKSQPLPFLPGTATSFIVAGFILLTALAVVLYFSISSLSGFLLKFSPVVIKKYSSAFSLFSKAELFQALFLSFVRYLIFSVQFFLLLKFFEVDISFSEACLLIPLVFFAVTVFPTITPAEIGVREFFSLQIIGQVSTNSAGIVLAAFFLWMINLAIPSLAGMVFILKRRVVEKEQREEGKVRK